MHNDEPESVAGGTEDGPNLARMFEAARAARSLTIDEIAAELRIAPRLLRALEECRFADLGPPVFAKGYLKQYGNRLGLKYEDLLAEYYRLVEPQDVVLTPSRTIRLRDERQIAGWVIAALGIALLAVFLFVWWFEEPVGPQVDTPSAAESAEGLGSEDASPAATPVAPPIEAPPRDDSGAREVDSGPAVLAAIASDAAARARGDGAQGAATAPVEEELLTSDEAPLGAFSGPTARMEMTFVEDCWAEVTDATGRRLFYGLGKAGASSSIVGAAPLDVFLGNAGGVTIVVDGDPFQVPRRGRQGNLARFAVAAYAD